MEFPNAKHNKLTIKHYLDFVELTMYIWMYTVQLPAFWNSTSLHHLYESMWTAAVKPWRGGKPAGKGNCDSLFYCFAIKIFRIFWNVCCAKL